MMKRNINLIAAGLTLGTLTLGVQAAPIAGVSYTYSNVQAPDFTGKDGPTGSAGAAQALVDGIGQSGVYTPTNFFWEPGQEGTIYSHIGTNVGTLPQPSATFDLGSVTDLANVNIHYGVRQGSGINAPVSVSVLVDGVSVGTFSDFDNAANADNFGDIRSYQIDLTGQTGQNVTLEFLGDDAGSFTGLTEVEFTAVPEPGSLALLALGGLLIARRRRGA